jgi:hypothetical protein
MRHAFSFPAHIREAVRAHVRKAIADVSPERFRQEPAYTAALLAHLHGVAYEGKDGSVVLRTTNIDSIGRGSAERWSGADLAITADIGRGNLAVSKAILAQAKLGDLGELSSGEHERLVGQIRDMRGLTRSPKVILIRELDGRREPMVASGTRISENVHTQPLSPPDYFVRRILTTLDGDTCPEFVSGAQQSSLKQLKVSARLTPRADLNGRHQLLEIRRGRPRPSVAQGNIWCAVQERVLIVSWSPGYCKCSRI